MFTIGFRGCDFHEKDACGSAGSASLTGSGLSAGSSQAVPLSTPRARKASSQHCEDFAI